ncbi:hypothetical protein GCM10011357_19700 [Lacimicrobium alkaliphilum]|uniref:N-acetyltransferase domain-containing protein n=2 Tax=Lacimicrobium alkaliphilum TaxID=1526571 RepID=A0ABQ1RAY1_9ALTE|nr:hypothetical protein GCM10011357_19700 [Lacimicrobium alkaliphilum]
MSVEQLEFVPFNTALSGDFLSINRQWIEDMFVMEPSDFAMLEDPYRYIIAPGGYIWFAAHKELGILGTCALHRQAEGVFELTKMGVRGHNRGLKVGEKLLRHVLEQSEKLSLACLYLLTNKKCAAAIHLYEKNGFVHSQRIMQRYGSAYERCDVAMEYCPDYHEKVIK